MKIEVKIAQSIDLFALTDEEAYEFFEQKVGETMYYYDKSTNSWYHLTEGNTTTYVKDNELLTILFKHMIDTVETQLLEYVINSTQDIATANLTTIFTIKGEEYSYHKLLHYLVENVVLTTPKVSKSPNPVAQSSKSFTPQVDGDIVVYSHYDQLEKIVVSKIDKS
jgi:hypothetical protein